MAAQKLQLKNLQLKAMQKAHQKKVVKVSLKKAQSQPRKKLKRHHLASEVDVIRTSMLKTVTSLSPFFFAFASHISCKLFALQLLALSKSAMTTLQ